MNRLGLALIALCVSTFAMGKELTLTMGAANWCPYTCPTTPKKPGIITEYLSWLLAKKGIQLEVSDAPWQRTVELSKKAQLDGLISLVPGEADWLLSTQTPTMRHQDCFYVKPQDGWRFQNITSLNGRSLGVIQSYGYQADLEDYIAAQQANPAAVLAISENNDAERLVKLLLSGRINTYVQDRQVNDWHQHRTKNAGCLTTEPVFLGLTDTPEHRELIRWLDVELKKLVNIQHRQAIERRYWQP